MTDDGDGSQRFESTIDDEEYLTALSTLGPSSTSEVAEEVGAPYRTAHHRLKRLEESGEVTSKKVGTAFLWQIADE